MSKTQFDESMLREFKDFLIADAGAYKEEATKGEWEVLRMRSTKYGGDPIIVFRTKRNGLSTFGEGSVLWRVFISRELTTK